MKTKYMLTFSSDCDLIGVPDNAKGKSFVVSEYWPIDCGREFMIKEFGHKGVVFSTSDILHSGGKIILSVEAHEESD